MSSNIFNNLSFPLLPIVAILKVKVPRLFFLKYSSSMAFWHFFSCFLSIFSIGCLPSIVDFLVGFACIFFPDSLELELLLACLFAAWCKFSFDLLFVFSLSVGGLQLIDCCLGLLIGFFGLLKFLILFKFLVCWNKTQYCLMWALLNRLVGNQPGLGCCCIFDDQSLQVQPSCLLWAVSWLSMFQARIEAGLQVNQNPTF